MESRNLSAQMVLTYEQQRRTAAKLHQHTRYHSEYVSNRRSETCQRRPQSPKKVLV